MKIEIKNAAEEKRILIGMIVDKNMLAMVAAKWEHNLFKVAWSNLIAGWCVDYYNRYQKAPKQNIEGIFETWAAETQDRKTVDIIEKFLDALSRTHEEKSKESNTDYLIDLAGNYFNRIRLGQLIEKTETALVMGKFDKAQKTIEDHRRVEIGVGAGVDVFQSPETLQAAHDEKNEAIIKYSGDLGVFYGSTLERDGFIAFMGPEKRGKSFLLMDMGYRAMLQRRKVAFFQVGDMSQNQMVRRLSSRVSRHPLKPCTIKYPTEINVGNENEAVVFFENRRFDTGLSWQKAWEASQNYLRKKMKTKESYFKLSTHANSSINVAGIENVLETWEREDWIADVVIIDYADILLMDKGDDSRNKINETWKQLRRLSQKKHCLVVTATQSDAASYDKDTMSRQNFSEDKRKLSHITGMIGINQTDGEKEQGVLRLNWIARRESHYTEKLCVHVAGCLAIASPCIKSTF